MASTPRPSLSFPAAPVRDRGIVSSASAAMSYEFDSPAEGSSTPQRQPRASLQQQRSQQTQKSERSQQEEPQMGNTAVAVRDEQNPYGYLVEEDEAANASTAANASGSVHSSLNSHTGPAAKTAKKKRSILARLRQLASKAKPSASAKDRKKEPPPRVFVTREVAVASEPAPAPQPAPLTTTTTTTTNSNVVAPWDEPAPEVVAQMSRAGAAAPAASSAATEDKKGKKSIFKPGTWSRFHRQ
ncbi:uncharacterized protein GGS25DRAFT_522860 [Hypoxylon fragiforme]|uniref:uncharacterized protein n=1 Tax=Hypoxylon fragiforme TaxID=63214 RepID=UPI0020C67370|nr:uncharacterized protein GGS25DRAFT_522860 [Hypoxylon fragiforme]KAI2607338.1 hypothetical protein GGS25DRAFT_522860 [Hypoxylon fragiforme]